jgi:hypothetical protein
MRATIGSVSRPQVAGFIWYIVLPRDFSGANGGNAPERGVSGPQIDDSSNSLNVRDDDSNQTSNRRNARAAMLEIVEQ